MSQYNTQQTSKFISLILRHGTEAIGITLDEHGKPVIYKVLSGKMQDDRYTF